MAKIRVFGQQMDEQRQWIRALLTDWGRWHAADQSLPPRARLRTPGDPIYSDNSSIEITHRAVLHVREISYGHYLLLETMYEPPSKSDREVLGLIGGRLHIGSLTKLRNVRDEAERMVASYRMGQTEIMYENTACMD